MPTINKLSLHQLRIRLAHTEALLPLTLLGLMTGILAGMLLILFRESVESISGLFMPEGEDSFELLEPAARLLLPLTGAFLLAMLIKSCPKNRRQYGIAHVIERLTFNRGELPLTSVIAQFFAALIALASGFSVGREGPAVHMGAGVGSFLGKYLNLPDNTLNALAGCGSAAAISASFNTPMAGVIFAMEVVMKEYTLNSFIPVMAASVCAAMMSVAVYGPEPAFQIPLIPMISLSELFVSAASAIAIGALAATFIKLNLFASRQRKGHIILPLMVAGILMGLIGLMVPEVMGTSYDTLGMILNGSSPDISFLLILLLCKLLMTSLVTGLGVPGGVIGPSMVIGAFAGTLLGILGDFLSGLTVSNISFHALVGMVAMMAAVLQAPLTALVTVLEMTHNPHIIMPAMFAIIIACLTSSQLFKQRGLFDMQFLTRGKHADISPLTRLLNQTGVASLMDIRFCRRNRYFDLNKENLPNASWILVEDERQVTHLLPVDALLPEDNESEVSVDLTQHQQSLPSHVINMRATLNDALRLMNNKAVDAVSVVATNRKGSGKQFCGVITRERIEEFYQSL